jgi:hypothetical protein
MISPDVALALLVNRTTQAYQTNQPAYIAYRERTHITGANRTQDINRTVAVRNADNYAIMRDLPNGGENIGQAFPIIPYFDPISTFNFGYFANLKRVDITVERGLPVTLPIPDSDPSVDAIVPYNSFWAARYAADSTDNAVHVVIDPTARVQNSFYPADVAEDATTHLPSHITMRSTGDDEVIALDYGVIEGHWMILHGIFSATEHALGFSFKVTADVTFDQFAFPPTAPDPRLAGTPAPSATP